MHLQNHSMDQRVSVERGYITLLSVLIAGAILVATTVGLLQFGLSSSRTSFAEEQSDQAKALADACVEEALQHIHDSAPFTGSDILTFGSGICEYTVENTGGSSRRIRASSTVATMVRKVEVTVTQIRPQITLGSWQEVADF